MRTLILLLLLSSVAPIQAQSVKLFTMHNRHGRNVRGHGVFSVTELPPVSTAGFRHAAGARISRNRVYLVSSSRSTTFDKKKPGVPPSNLMAVSGAAAYRDIPAPVLRRVSRESIGRSRSHSSPSPRYRASRKQGKIPILSNLGRGLFGSSKRRR